jgi:hypothetical protein
MASFVLIYLLRQVKLLPVKTLDEPAYGAIGA